MNTSREEPSRRRRSSNVGVPPLVVNMRLDELDHSASSRSMTGKDPACPCWPSFFGTPFFGFNVPNGPAPPGQDRSKLTTPRGGNPWGVRQSTAAESFAMDVGQVVEIELRPVCRPSPYHLAMPPQLVCGAETYSAAGRETPAAKGQEDPRLARRTISGQRTAIREDAARDDARPLPSTATTRSQAGSRCPLIVSSALRVLVKNAAVWRVAAFHNTMVRPFGSESSPAHR